MSDALQAARNQIEIFRRSAKLAQDRNDETNAQAWLVIAGIFQTLADEYERFREATRPIPAGYGDISDLPESLRRQLAFLRTDELDDQISMIVKAAANGADLDTILIELWRRFQVEQTRRFVQNKAYRLAGKHIIFSVPGRKGLYAGTAEIAKRLAPAAPAASTPAPDASADDLAADFEDLNLDNFEETDTDA